VIEHAASCAHKNLTSVFKFPDLGVNWHPTINRAQVELVVLMLQCLESLGNLKGKFPRGRKHNRLRLSAVEQPHLSERLNDGQRKGQSFARTSQVACDNVLL